MNPTAQPRRGSGYTQPPGWHATVNRIIKRDRGICYLCRRPGATSVDHIVPVSHHGGHHDTNLAAVHPDPCHAVKTETERRQALAAKTRRRPARKHPGLI